MKRERLTWESEDVYRIEAEDYPLEHSREVEMPADDLEWVRRVEAEWDRVQRYLGDLYAKAYQPGGAMPRA